MSTTSARRTYSQTIYCPGCGRPRELTDRHVRRGGTEKTLCNLCRFPPRKLAITNTERRFWLRRYTDEEIALMAESISNGIANRMEIRSWRVRLEIAEPNDQHR